jgi:hypothetical protein
LQDDTESHAIAQSRRPHRCAEYYHSTTQRWYVVDAIQRSNAKATVIGNLDERSGSRDDARPSEDLLQIKYEMLRQVEIEK